MKSRYTRRSFLKTSAVATAALSAASWNRVRGANDAVRVAVVGFKGRGGDHIGGFSKQPGVRVAALCDIDTRVLGGQVQKLKDAGNDVKGYKDVREVIAARDVDIISTATPNHWHSLITVWACQANKDVYVEKPVSHNVWEGRKAVEAARKYKRIVQTGTQSRSSQAIREAVAWVRAGNLGKILLSRGLCYKPRQSIGKVDGPQPIPEGVDYDLWCGPAPMSPLMRKNLHYDWHWVFETGNGDLGNQGIHQMDIARWFLGEKELSPVVVSVGGRLGYIDDGNTPNTQIVYHGYEKAPLLFEVRGLPKDKASQAEWGKNMDRFMDGQISVVVHCEGGHVLVPNYSSAIAFDRTGEEIKRWEGAKDHYQNFIDAVRSRQVDDLNADILEGHLSSALCHTGNISYQLGKRLEPGAAREQLKDFGKVQQAFDRMADHLRRNGVNLKEDQLTVGVGLRMDPSTEKFLGNADANKLLTRDYRKPYVVPENV
ncbi:MAG: Gfo/Idh/MocA family oxidoreductase [Nitrospira sp.]|nr:Gfo/Idh/MocA family oxidoreductase [Nitrospira sp.]